MIDIPEPYAYEIDPRDDEPDEQLPRYSDRGRILFELHHVYQPYDRKFGSQYETTVLDYDSDKSPFWLNEGMGIEYFLDDVVDLELPGVYVLEGVAGAYYKGTWGFEDDDEEWWFDTCRRASPEEEESGALGVAINCKPG